MQFDHEKLDVYRVSIDLVAWTQSLMDRLHTRFHNTRNQIVRSVQAIPLNIAEGIGKRSENDRRRYLEIARGSAMETAAAFDVLAAIGACRHPDVEQGKNLLWRVVSMLTKMTEAPSGRS